MSPVRAGLPFLSRSHPKGPRPNPELWLAFPPHRLISLGLFQPARGLPHHPRSRVVGLGKIPLPAEPEDPGPRPRSSLYPTRADTTSEFSRHFQIPTSPHPSAGQREGGHAEHAPRLRGLSGVGSHASAQAPKPLAGPPGTVERLLRYSEATPPQPPGGSPPPTLFCIIITINVS